jgi:hypothetical protein
MALTEADLPAEWTEHYGQFISIGDQLVLATCRKCFGLVNSDHFTHHRSWHADLTVRTFL